MLRNDHKTIVVGAGQSGYAVATTLRKLDPGREIVLFGDEAHPPYERPPLSKDVLLDDDAPLPVFLPAAEYAARGIGLETGARVARIDRAGGRVILGDGREHPYGSLVLTTGSRPARLDIEGAAHVLYLRSFEDAVAIRRRLNSGTRLLCIGAGVIGLELAATARQRGVEVTVVEAGDTVMARGLPAPERAFLLDLHRQNGVGFRFGVTVASLHKAAGVTVATLSTGEAVEADIVVAGIGIVRNDELARDAGLAVDRGVLVDEFGMTGDPSILCAGDAAAFWHPTLGQRLRLESWYHALDHAAAVARAIVERSTPYAPVPRYWSDQYGLNIQVAGDHAQAAAVSVEGERPGHKYVATYLDTEGCVVAAVCVNDPRRVRPFLKSIAAREQAASAVVAAARPIAAEDGPEDGGTSEGAMAGPEARHATAGDGARAAGGNQAGSGGSRSWLR